jgi:hypothetical protein
MSQLCSGNPSIGTETPIRESAKRNALWIAIVFACLLGLTRPNTMGDGPSYANDIATRLGKSPFGHGNPLWEFGHLLWRPLGWTLTSLLSPLLSGVTDWTPFMQVSFVLIALSALSGIVTVVLWFLLLVDIMHSRLAAFLIALAMSCSHGFLLYSHSSCAYIPGLMCLTYALYLLRKGNMAASALFYAFAILIWFPFILAGAALLLIAACPSNWEMSLKQMCRAVRPGQLVCFAAISCACVIVVFGLAMTARQISSSDEARNWYSNSRHGIAQHNKAVRIATGLPRSLLSLGKDGVLYKRYLKHDPYAPVAITDLITASLWKILAFDFFLVCLLYELLRRSQSGWPLLLLLAGACPVIFFAVFLFEPSMPERYLPALSFLIISIGYVLRDLLKTRRTTQFIVAGFLACVVVNNAYTFAAPRISGQERSSWHRLAGLRDSLTNSDVVVVMTNQDEILDLMGHPFSAFNRPEPIRIYDVIEPATVRCLQWREEFADKALKVWDQGGQIWISKRLWINRPRPDWEWVEGDDPSVTWTEVPLFFSPLQTDTDSGGEDGFYHLTRNSVNWNYLTPFAASYRPPVLQP